jgi:hypothetical protein
MRIPHPDDIGRATAARLLGPAQRAGFPIPACLLAFEVLRLLAGAGLAVAVALASGGLQGGLLGAGALLATGSAVVVIPVFLSEWRAWDADLRERYRVRALRLTASGVPGRLARAVPAVGLVAALAVFGGGIPGAAASIGAGFCVLLWVDLLSAYANCAAPAD